MEWAPISGFPNYEVSRSGDVQNSVGEILSKTVNKENGYVYTSLYHKGYRKNCAVHRLVGLAFVENPDDLPCINHKDGDKTNNNDWNLEWSTYSMNNKHLYAIGLRKGGKRGKSTNKTILLDTQTGVFYDCMKDAADAIGMKYTSLCHRMNPNLKKYKNTTNFIYTYGD